MNNHLVYWYHLEKHIDPFIDGYIGVTNNINRRHLEHMRNSNNLANHFYNAIEYYGKENIQLTILKANISMQEAYDLESIYRPDINIGWNYAAGGKEDLISIRSIPVTLFHCSNPTKDYTFNSITEAANILNINIARISQAIIRKSNIYGYDGWSVIHENTDKKSILTISEAAKLKNLGIKRIKPNYFKGKSRWSIEDKKRISLQHKGKIISNEQKEIVRQKNRKNSMCKQVQLNHINEPNTIYTFHSISEASRVLNIPLPRLKSKCSRTLNIYGKDGWCVVSIGSQDTYNERI